MKASEPKLQRVIEGTNQYVVPLFQRPYSWDTKEWSVLWDDLVELADTAHCRPVGPPRLPAAQNRDNTQR